MQVETAKARGGRAITAIMFTDTEAAYLAGIIDGEGTVTIMRDSRGPEEWRYRVRLSVSNTSIELMEFLHPVGGHISVEAGPQRTRTCYAWILTGSSAVVVLRNVVKYLIVKRKHAEHAIRFEESRKSLSADELERAYVVAKSMNLHKGRNREVGH